MGPSAIIIFLFVSTALASAKEYVLEDLIAEEDNPDNRRVIHNIGDDEDQSKGKKVTRQSRIEDTIRIVQEPITGPGSKQEQSQGSTVKDKGGGKKDEEDEDKKTLSQQVADGKYGLIQTEIFNNNPSRPGVVSYEINPEVPKDNVNNLGGLKQEEIWLAENHLLVLSGGGFKDKNLDQPIWPAIDNYIAPSRQVKIPPNPKVPPPFPVQLKPGGPLEFIKNENGTGGPPPFSSPFNGPFPPSPNATFPYPPSGFNPGNFTLGNGPFLPPPFPFLPQPPNGSYFLPPPGFLPPIPPGAAFLPPPGNLTDQFDEDDPSIYYPPPYDFYYPKDNSSLVPPGPLVPGIVLPPPPDFFAPFKNTTASKSRRPGARPHLKNKTPTRKPTKNKNVQIITSTEEPFSGVTIRPHIGKINLVTTTPAPVFYTNKVPTVNTDIYTRRPIVQTTTDNSINEIDLTPPTIVHALPPNAIVKGWVPIPAPRPYYITGSRKQHSKDVTSTLPPDYNSVTHLEDQGYVYNTPHRDVAVNRWVKPNKTKAYNQEQYYNIITEPPKQDYYYDDFYSDRGQYYSSTESPLGYEDPTQLKSIYYPSRNRVNTAPHYNLQTDSRGKSLKTYYFYEEPHISQGKLTDTETGPSKTPSQEQKHKAGDSHTITEEEFINTAVKQSLQGPFKSSPLDYFYHQDAYLNGVSQTSTTQSPLQYYFVPEENKDYVDYPYPPAGGVSTPRTPTSTKPPVYEYSFAIPGYEAPPHTKVEQIKPEPVQTSYEYQTTPKPYQEPIYTTPSPTTTPTPHYKNSNQGHNQYFTTKKPHSQYYATQSPGKGSVQTENPYHAFFTHHDADLIDDITKKYFTTFGQKINKDSIRGDSIITTPLPPAEDVSLKTQYQLTSPRPQYYDTDRPKTRYPQNTAPFRSPGYYAPSRPTSLRNYPPSVSNSHPIYSEFYDQRPHPSLVSTQKPISLGSDILVNFKEPLPPLNPDAEFIDPSSPALGKPDQSFISYRLPGNGGGHFFFLTPQIVQQSNHYPDYTYNSEQAGPYYKRNIQRSQTQRRRTVHTRTS